MSLFPKKVEYPFNSSGTELNLTRLDYVIQLYSPSGFPFTLKTTAGQR